MVLLIFTNVYLNINWPIIENDELSIILIFIIKSYSNLIVTLKIITGKKTLLNLINLKTLTVVTLRVSYTEDKLNLNFIYTVFEVCFQS